jgi:hypothetical protein
MPRGYHLDRKDRSARPSVTTVVTLMLALTLGGFVTAVSGLGSAVDRHLALYVNTVGGWATIPGGETNPGPALAVVRGDHVIVDLTSEDGLDHGLFIDYNNNGLADPGIDYISPTTTSSTSFSFDPNQTGDFDYCDQLVLLNCGRWSTREPNRAPTATIESPTTGTSWTGGLAHDIVFNVSDPDGDPVTVSLSYNYSGGQGTIAGPFVAGPNPNRYSWTPTGFHSPDTVVHLVAQDPGALSTTVDTPAFEVDSTIPTIVSTTPARGATSVDRGIGITVAWSEDMNVASGAPDTFAVRVQGGPWIPGTVAWSVGTSEMTFRPTSLLSASTTYEVVVNATARDSSDPGNAFDGPDTWTFGTGAGADSNRPNILGVSADPPQQYSDTPVNLTADVQDDVGVAGVSANITGPSFSENVTMEHLSGTRWYVSQTFVEIGTYDAVVWATDNAGNAASQPLSFDISPRGNPNIPAPASVTATSLDGGVEVTWTAVSFPGLSGYHVYRRDAAKNDDPFRRLTISPLRPTGPTVYRDGPETGRTYLYTVTAVNETGAESVFAPASRVTVPPYQPSPLLNPVPWAIAGVTLAIILGVLYGTIWRRKLA